MATDNQTETSTSPTLNVPEQSNQNVDTETVLRAPKLGERNFLREAVDLLPKNFSAGVFGEKNPRTGRREGGVAGFFMLDSFRNAFGPERIYENRRNRLISEGYSQDEASDFAYRIATGQGMEGLDDATKTRLKWDNRIDKGLAALDAPTGLAGKGFAIGAGIISKSGLDSVAGAISRRFFGNGKKIFESDDIVTGSRTAARESGSAESPRITIPKQKVEDPKAKRAIDEVTEMLNQKPPKLEAAKQKTSKFYNKLRTQWTDRFTPIRNLTTTVEKVTGKKFEFKQDPYVAARLYQGVNGKIQNTLDKMGESIRKVGNYGSPSQANLSNYLIQKRLAERAARGIKNPRNITQDEAEAAARALETPEIKRAADEIKNITDDLLEQSYKGGIINREAYESIRQNNQNYIPFDVLEKMEENVDNVNKAAGGFSVAEQNVIKSLQGTDKDIADPLEALVRKIVQTTRLVERNEVAKKVADIRNLEGVEDVKKFDEENPLESGNDIFHTYENGQKVSYQAPKDVIESMKGLNREEADMVTNLFGAVNKVFRQSVTTLYIGFSLPNIFRDVQDAQLIAKHRFGVIDWAEGLSQAIGKGKLYKQWREDGGAFSTYVSQATSARMNVREVAAGTARKAIRTIMNPLRLFEAIGSVTEEATRLAVYRAAIRKGETRQFAAYESRQATVDFARSGKTMRLANQWVPFLNARLQGSLNLARVGKERPGRLALRSAFLVGGPAMMTYLHNREYPEYYDIPQWEKDANFIIMIGKYTDKDGEVQPEYIKIPKGHIGRIVANPLENFMVMQDSGGSEEWDKLALKLASGVSPVSFESEGEPSITAALAGTIPPPFKVPTEVHFANKDFFTGRDIVPMSRQEASSQFQYTDRTSEAAKDLGNTEFFKALGLSPAGIDQYVQGFLGPLGKDAVKAFDTIRGKGSVYDSEATGIEKIKQIPVINRFVGNYGGRQDANTFEVISDLRTEAADRRIEEEAVAKDILETIRVSSAEALPEILKDYEEQGMLTEGVKRRIKDTLRKQRLQIDSKDAALKRLATDERAKYIISVIRETDADDLPRVLKQFEAKGILTDAVEDDIRRLLSQFE